MSSMIPHIRLVLENPIPSCAAEFGPFQTIQDTDFAHATLTYVGPEDLLRLQALCRQGFPLGQSLGICRLKKPKAIFFDMDSTVIEEESVVELAKVQGVGEQVEKVTEAAMAGELDFEAALRERVQLLAGLPLVEVQKVAQSLRLTEGMQAFAGFCRRVGVPIYLVSGGFYSLANTLQDRLGFSEIRANSLENDGKALTGGLVGQVIDAAGKREFVQEVCHKLGCSPLEVAAVGDGANDLPMLQAVGCAVGFRPKAVLYNDIDAQACKGGHSFLAPLLFGRCGELGRSGGYA